MVLVSSRLACARVWRFSVTRLILPRPFFFGLSLPYSTLPTNNSHNPVIICSTVGLAHQLGCPGPGTGTGTNTPSSPSHPVINHPLNPSSQPSLINHKHLCTLVPLLIFACSCKTPLLYVGNRVSLPQTQARYCVRKCQRACCRVALRLAAESRDQHITQHITCNSSAAFTPYARHD